MSDVASQKRLSASILKCGVNRVWFDPERISDIENAISREDLRGLITDGASRRTRRPVSAAAGHAYAPRSVHTATARASGNGKAQRVHGPPASGHGSRRSAQSEKHSSRSAMPVPLTGTSTGSSTERQPAGSSGVSRT